MATREEINQRLEDFLWEKGSGCHASVQECGSVHLDHVFKMEHLKEIMIILEDLDEQSLSVKGVK